MGFLDQTWVQILLVVVLIGLLVWWFKFRPQY
jgi:hypothetical protein